MFCQKCGKEIEDDSKFCEFCGAEQTLLVEKKNVVSHKKRFIFIGSMLLAAMLMIGGGIIWRIQYSGVDSESAKGKGKSEESIVPKEKNAEREAAAEEGSLIRWIPADIESLGEKGPLYLSLTMTEYADAAPEIECTWPTSEYAGVLAAKELDSDGENTECLQVSSSASALGSDGGALPWALTVTSGTLHSQTGEAAYSEAVTVLDTGYWYQGNHALFLINGNGGTYLYSLQAFSASLQAVNRFVRADVYKIDGTVIQKVKSLIGNEMTVLDVTNSANTSEGQVLCQAEMGATGENPAFYLEAATSIRDSLGEYYVFGDWFLEEYVKRFTDNEASNTAFGFPFSEKESAAVDILRTEQQYIREGEDRYGVIQYYDYTDIANRMETELKRQGKETKRTARPELSKEMIRIDGGTAFSEHFAAIENNGSNEVIPAGQIEDKVAEIRDMYVETNAKIESGEYKECIDYNTGIKGYGYGGQSRRIEISAGMDPENNIARIYQYNADGELIFVLLLEEKTEKRLYFSAGKLFRYRYQIRGGDAVNYDNDFSNLEFAELGETYAADGEKKYADIFVAYRVNLTNASEGNGN